MSIALPDEPERPRGKFFGARAQARYLEAENHRLRTALEQLDGLGLVEIRDVITQARQALAALDEQHETTVAELETAQAQLLDVRRDVLVQQRGLYDVEHPAEASPTLAEKLSTVRARIHHLVARGDAVGVATDFRLNKRARSAIERALPSQLSALALAAYDAEAENAIRMVEPGRLDVARARLDRFAQTVSECGHIVDLHIDPEYHRLRTVELELAAQHAAALAGEAETERDHRAALAQSSRVADRLRHERSLLELEREHCSSALAVAHARADTAETERQVARLADLDQALADITGRTVDTRAGYVYVVSNIGSFGDGVVKIGMTRRPDPMNHIRELADESVPFDFDVHAMFFAPDAVAVLAVLHEHLADRRVNLVNHRREFFRATPLEVFNTLATHRIGVPEFRTRPGATEYRTSAQMAR
ncbi:MAG: DUF4041 domain-containing protein [Micrococcales bacterium]|nr:DUF4041 domain-containing protein [Micrococcales bacterium]MCL2666928.1 DUF4041 domain-containing protein [Micrococcales bacterium]